MESAYDTTKIFKFNLIPPKTKEEIEVLEERDSSVVYGFLLIFFAVFVFFILTLVHAIVVDARLDSLKEMLSKRDATIATYDGVVAEHGELFLKAKSLSTILKKDIQTKEFLSLSNSLTAEVGGASIVDYSREEQGEFTLNILIPSFEGSLELLGATKNYPQISDFRILRIAQNADSGEVQVLVSFVLENA